LEQQLAGFFVIDVCSIYIYIYIYIGLARNVLDSRSNIVESSTYIPAGQREATHQLYTPGPWMLVSSLQPPHSRCCCFSILADATATATTAILLTRHFP
jgi:hypothetical protein